MKKIPIEKLQGLGRALMLPIAVLPVAALMLRLGQPDVLNIPYIAAAGDAIFANLGLIFAVGVAVGFARENHGAAGLAGVVCYFVATKGAEVLIQIPAASIANFEGAAHDLALAAAKAKTVGKFSVPVGILSGALSGYLYNRFSNIKLPDYLAFFGGRRFVPIASGLAGLLLALVFGLSWSYLANGMDAASMALVQSGNIGLFIYGVINRLLIVTGLHHIVNNVVWFIVGDYHGATGDLKRFFAGDPSAGMYMSGFFPVMMFGLPAACLAMYRTARPERRKAVGGMLLSLGLTSFLTGVTEPVEFTFMFLAPALFVIHAILTGIAMVIMNVLQVKLGFGFSAGLFDYVLNFGKATNPLLLLPVGLAYGAVYYATFRFVIVKFNLMTPGRDEQADVPASAPQSATERAVAFIVALGGSSNLATVDACTTRLRLIVNDQARIDEKQLKALGAKGVVRPAPRAVQVVLGPIADQVAGEIRGALPYAAQPAPPAIETAPIAAHIAPSPMRSTLDVGALLAALGGKENVTTVESRSTRLRVIAKDASKIDAIAAIRAGARAVAQIDATTLHVVIGPAAQQIALELNPLIRVS